MKKVFILGLFLSALAMTAQEKKQYKSAESGQYVSKSTADKNPSTTYGTPRKSSAGTGSETKSVEAPKVKTTTTSSAGTSKKSKF